MSSFIGAVQRWLKHRLPIPNSRESWLELAALALLLADGYLAWRLREKSPWVQAIPWVAFCILAAILVRRGAVKLFGPVLFYDLLRVGRRGRYIIFRTLYVIALFLLLGYVYAIWQEQAYFDNRTSLSRSAEFAESFFFTLMVVQLLVVLILTPAYLAGAIAEEKDRKTLEFLLATDLRSREIVLSKLLARLANMSMIVLAALPVLSATQFFGGVDPDLLLASFAALGLTMMSLAAVSILMSVHSRRPRDAIVLTYLMVVMYPVVSSLALALLASFPSLGVQELIPLPGEEGMWWLTLNDLVGAFSAGNLFWVLFELGRTLSGGGTLAAVLPVLLRNYAIFHGSLTLLCTVWAVVRLRPVALKESLGKTAKGSLGLRLFGRPRVGTQPMLWKEIFAESRLNFHWIGRIAVCILVAVSFLPVVFILYEYLDQYGTRTGFAYQYDYLGMAMNVWVRSAGTIVAVLLLLAVAVRASGSISGERDKQTFDSLLTTPLESHQILLAKWVGAVLSVRWGWVWLGTMWMLAVVTGGIPVFVVPALVLAWIIYAGVFACVGLWYSVVSRTTLRATLWTLLTTLFIGGGHWVVSSMCCFLPMNVAGMRGTDAELLAKFFAGQTPPAVFAILAFHGREFEGGRDATTMLELIGFSVFGLGCWAVAGLVLGNFLMERFRRAANRQPIQAADRQPPEFLDGRKPGGDHEAEDLPLLVPENQEGEREA